MMVLRAVIVDDEPLARASVRSLLEAEADIEVVGEYARGDQALPALRRRQADLLFLDVDMPGLNGFDLVRALQGGAAPAVIFVTAHEEHALQAFEVQALDYLVKPFGASRFREAVQRAREGLADQRADPVTRVRAALDELRGELGRDRGRYDPLRRFAVKKGSRTLLIRAAEVDWLEAQGNYVRLHSGGSSYLIRGTMAALEKRLGDGPFLRIHRSTIVNLDRVRELRPWVSGDYLVILEDGTELRLSRGYRQKLEARLGSSFEAPD